MTESRGVVAAGTLRRLWMFVLLDGVTSVCLAGRSPRAHGNSVVLLLDMLRGRVQSDSLFPMGRAWAALCAGRPVYEAVFFGGPLKFIYPASSLALFSVAALLHGSAAGLLLGLTWASMAGIFWLAGEVLLGVVDSEGRWTRGQCWQVRLAGAVVALLFYPVLSGVSLGQVQTLLTCLWMLAVQRWMRGRTAGAGVCLGLICAFKPTLGIFVLWGLLRRQWRFLGALGGTLVTVEGLSVVLYGWHNTVEYLRVLSFLSQRGEAFVANQSVNGLLERWIHNGNPAVWSFTVFPPYNAMVYAVTAVSSGVLLAFGLGYPMARRWRDGTADFLLFGMLSTVASPIAWVHHYGYFLPGCLYLLGRMVSARGGLRAVGLVCFLVLTNAWPLLERFGGTRWNPVLSYDLYAGLGLLVVLVVWTDRAGREVGVQVGVPGGMRGRGSIK